MESQELATAQNLRAHVEWLAGQIGERNIFRPQALQNAAEYIESQWRRQGYAVERFGYEVSGIRCFNLEITRSGAEGSNSADWSTLRYGAWQPGSQ